MFKIEFKTDGNSFEEDGDYEVKRILKELILKLDSGKTSGSVFDVNGNKIGVWGYDE